MDVYKNIEEYNLNKKRKISIIFDDIFADMLNKKLNQTETELFIRAIKLNIPLAFITQSYYALFRVPVKASSFITEESF